MSIAVSWNSRETTAVVAARTSNVGHDGVTGVIGAIAIAPAPTSATPVVNHGRSEASMPISRPQQILTTVTVIPSELTGWPNGRLHDHFR